MNGTRVAWNMEHRGAMLNLNQIRWSAGALTPMWKMREQYPDATMSTTVTTHKGQEWEISMCAARMKSGAINGGPGNITSPRRRRLADPDRCRRSRHRRETPLFPRRELRHCAMPSWAADQAIPPYGFSGFTHGVRIPRSCGSNGVPEAINSFDVASERRFRH